MGADAEPHGTILRHSPSRSSTIPELPTDPALVDAARRRLAAFAGLATLGYLVAYVMSVSLHVYFGGQPFHPLRLKSLGMAAFCGFVYQAARRSTWKLPALTRLGHAMVILIGTYSAVDHLHYFQWPEDWTEARLAPLLGTSLEPSVVEGLSWPCLLLLIFPPFIPGRPRQHFWLACAAISPLMLGSAAWAISSGRSYWAILSPMTFANVPIALALSVAISTSIHRVSEALGRERRRSRELGSYEIVKQIGAGGMGEVWLANHKMLARPAALKLIKAERIEGTAERVNRTLKRFEREAKATANLRSQHTVELYDFGRTEDGDFYYVMELLDGVDLHELVRQEGPQPPARVAWILEQACLSLAEAHDQQLVHRDIKPANIFLCRHGNEYDVVKVLDFGLVATRHKGEKLSETGPVTREHELLGTPAFMAPEMILGDTKDHRSDLYALACVGYWLLTGRLVFERETIAQICASHLHEQPDPPSAHCVAPIPEALERALLAGLEKNPDDRPFSALEFRELICAGDASKAWTEELRCQWWAKRSPAPASSSSSRDAAL